MKEGTGSFFKKVTGQPAKQKIEDKKSPLDEIRAGVEYLKIIVVGPYFDFSGKYFKILEVNPTDDPAKVEVEIDIPLEGFRIKGLFDIEATLKLLKVMKEELRVDPPGYLDGVRENENLYFRQETMKKFIEQHVVGIVGSELHEEWRAPRKKEDGTFEPRMKKTKDQVWSQAHGGVEDVDIANTPYDQLPEDWKGENKISAEIAVKEIFKASAEGRDLDKKFVEEASSVLHDKWLERNGGWASEEQKKPYAELSEEEKEKDRVIIRKAIERYLEIKKPL